MSGVTVECNNPQSVSEITINFHLQLFRVGSFSNKLVSPTE